MVILPRPDRMLRIVAYPPSLLHEIPRELGLRRIYQEINVCHGAVDKSIIRGECQRGPFQENHFDICVGKNRDRLDQAPLE
jgi:hypothetical protein